MGQDANKSRGSRAKADADGPHEQQATRSPSAGVARRRWAALIKRVWHVDPMRCPSCGAAMKIISFIEPTQPDFIRKIRTHCGLADEPARAPPQAPPPTRELHYVSDLEFVHDPGPAEPTWSADWWALSERFEVNDSIAGPPGPASRTTHNRSPKIKAPISLISVKIVAPKGADAG